MWAIGGQDQRARHLVCFEAAIGSHDVGPTREHRLGCRRTPVAQHSSRQSQAAPIAEPAIGNDDDRTGPNSQAGAQAGSQCIQTTLELVEHAYYGQSAAPPFRLIARTQVI